jgi:hypothetical protein
MPLLAAREDMGRIHGVDEKIPVEGIAEMTTTMAALIERWNAPGRSMRVTKGATMATSKG